MSVRVGPQTGTYLKVDELPPSNHTNTSSLQGMAPDSTRLEWFGGPNVPVLDVTVDITVSCSEA